MPSTLRSSTRNPPILPNQKTIRIQKVNSITVHSRNNLFGSSKEIIRKFVQGFGWVINLYYLPNDKTDGNNQHLTLIRQKSGDFS